MCDEKRICPVCGQGTLSKIIQSETFSYKGHQYSIPDLISFKCNLCSEAIIDPESWRKVGKIAREHVKVIDGFLTGKEVKRVRINLGLTQEQFSEILGGGEKCVAKYESEALTQSKPMDNLLKIIREIPEAILVLKGLYKPHNIGTFHYSYSECYNPGAANEEKYYQKPA